MMKKIVLLFVCVCLAACGSVKKIESGSRMVGDRMAVSIEGNWNHADYPSIKPAEIWTMEGVTIDTLLFYSGIKDGQAMHPENPSRLEKKNFVFRSAMQPEDVVSMFEGVLTRGEATFRLIKLEPYPFGGKKGFRFEFERTRKQDNVRQLGITYGAIDRGELFALVYHAPRLTFFPRHQSKVEEIARSVRIH